jgi:hypothetical protein
MRLSALVLASLCALPLQAQTPSWTAADMRADLARLRQHVMETERAYTNSTRASALSVIDSLDQSVATLRPVSFELGVARVIALADNGHSSLPGPQRAARYNRIELRFAAFGEDLYVLRARDRHTDLLGARLIAIDGHAYPALRAAGHRLHGGPASWRDRFLPNFVESPEQLHAMGLATRSDRATLQLQLANGRTVTREFVAMAPDSTQPRVPSGRWMFADTAVSDGTPWRALLTPDAAPWALRDAAARFRFRRLPELGAVVIELRQNMSSPGHDLPAFLRAMSDSLRAIQPNHVVLDMRMNGGGDLNRTRDFVQQLPAAVSGRIFVLTSPYTFSAAISTVGYLKQAAPQRVSIVGEMVGDRLEFWAEGRGVNLANTGIRLGNATERHDYRTGCEGFRDCHGSVVRNPIRVASLEPDVAAPWTIDGYRAGRDPAIEAVAASLREHRGRV